MSAHDNVIHLKQGDDLKKILAENKNVILDFTATWCQPCQKLGPVLEQKAKEAGGKFIAVKVNVDDFDELLEEYDAASIPRVFLYQNGVRVSDFKGLKLDDLDKMFAACQ